MYILLLFLTGEHLTGEYRDKVSHFKRLPVIQDDSFLLAESVAIFRHLNREKIVPEHWYPRRNFGRSRVDEFLEWQQRNMGLACSNYFKQKWLLPILGKTSTEETNASLLTERLNQSFKDFENLIFKQEQIRYWRQPFLR
ncbi:PREDICTED: glutathione S-transferase theta-1 [Rhagoletis zephyria]|uniref:glutathione S-transferase theta-1 n=1 Tax=Rhagoletis zephyria TaxID=28612 RepID=UPI00081123BA|nr:PREDICTED: glutathione S-transferase theta-1 [Rhagoletis zephyria]